MGNDNTTPMSAAEYDNGIENTIPYYSEFHRQTISVIENTGLSPLRWLDLGCGTGTLTRLASETFSDASFVLLDPSEAMLKLAKEKNDSLPDQYICSSSTEIEFRNEFNVITAVQSHLYLREAERARATENVYRALVPGGIYITFENVVPESESLKEAELRRWGKYQLSRGKSEEAVREHIARCGVKYFPITVQQHTELLRSVGFKLTHLFWYSYMQMGMYAVR